MDQRSHKGNYKNLKTNENENTIFRNLWDAENTMLRGKFLAINIYIKKYIEFTT